jgi:hypothetical protein
MSQPSIELAQRWLEFRPVGPQSVSHANTPRFSAAAPGRSASPVLATPSASVITGKNGRSAATIGDVALKSAGSDVDKLTDALIRNPIVAATTLMGLARKASGYNPVDPAQAGNYPKFNDYVTRMLDAPFFHLGFSDQKNLHHESSNWDSLIDNIVSLFDGVLSEDKSRIMTGLKQLAHSATSTSDKTETMNVFCQQAVSVDSSKVTVGIYHSGVSMIEHKGKHTTQQADFSVFRAFLTFNTETWPTFAKMVAAKEITSATDWLSSMSSLGPNRM